MHRFTIKTFCIILLILSHILLHVFKNFSSSIRKNLCFIKEFKISAHIQKDYTHGSILSSPLYEIKYFKPSSPKKTLLDINIVLISSFSILISCLEQTFFNLNIIDTEFCFTHLYSYISKAIMTFHGYTILFSNSCGFCLSFSDIFIFLLVPYSHFFSFSSFIVLYIYFKLTIVIFIYFFHNILFLFPDHLHDGSEFFCLFQNRFFVAPIISIATTHLLFIDKKNIFTST